MKTIKMTHETKELINHIENTEHLNATMQRALLSDNSYGDVIKCVYLAVETFFTNDLLNIEFNESDIEQTILFYLN